MKNIIHSGLILLVLIVLGVTGNNGQAVAAETGAERFTVSGDGVIYDAETGFEWVVGPDKDTTYEEAKQWVAACSIAGWRMADADA